jgi:hypothetical protein
MPGISEPPIGDQLFAAMGMPVLMHFTGIRFRYIPKTGERRDIEAMCLYEEGSPRDDEISETRHERLWLAVSRDPLEGVESPQLGDSGLRDGDNADSPWSFQGEIRNESAFSWELLFARNRPQRYGPRTV